MTYPNMYHRLRDDRITHTPKPTRVHMQISTTGSVSVSDDRITHTHPNLHMYTPQAQCQSVMTGSPNPPPPKPTRAHMQIPMYHKLRITHTPMHTCRYLCTTGSGSPTPLCTHADTYHRLRITHTPTHTCRYLPQAQDHPHPKPTHAPHADTYVPQAQGRQDHPHPRAPRCPPQTPQWQRAWGCRKWYTWDVLCCAPYHSQLTTIAQSSPSDHPYPIHR